MGRPSLCAAKRSGRFDLGILDLGSAGECVRRVRTVRYLRRHATGQAPVQLHTVHAEVSACVACVLEIGYKLVTGYKKKP